MATRKEQRDAEARAAGLKPIGPAETAKKSTRARKTGNGAGWGGPAKGPGTGKSPLSNPRIPGPGRGHFSLAGEARHERDARIAEEMRDFYYQVVTTPDEPTPNRLVAATKLLDRIEGLPVQKVVTQQADVLSRMTDQELDQAAAETRRRIAAHEAAKSDRNEVDPPAGADAGRTDARGPAASAEGTAETHAVDH